MLDQSKSIFSGMIKVENEARFTDALQTNRNLLMSDEAEADSMPGWKFQRMKSSAVMYTHNKSDR